MPKTKWDGTCDIFVSYCFIPGYATSDIFLWVNRGSDIPWDPSIHELSHWECS